jgi:hypothetical protein
MGTAYPQIVLANGATDLVRGVTQTDIVSGGTGYITTLGFLNNVNTSSFVAGTKLYAQASGVIGTTVTGLPVGVVIKQNATTGIVYVENTGITRNDLSDLVIPDATTVVKGKIKLAGDLSGTADVPTVPGLAGKEPTIVATTSADYYRGDKTFQPLNKAAVGLSAVDNTSDVNKPVSIAQAAADAAVQAFSIQRANHTGTQSASTITGLAAVATSGLKADVGLGNVDNTSDANKPVSSAQQTALNLKEDLTNKATSLVSPDNTKYPTTLAVSNAIGAIVSGVSSFNTRTGAVLPQSGDYTKSDVGLANVDNTSDANKPISTATATALSGKEPTITAGTTSQYYRGDKSFQTLDKSAVGLGNVDNTSDANKPVSTAQSTALSLKVDKAGDNLTGTLFSSPTPGTGYYNSLITSNADPEGYAVIGFETDLFKQFIIGTTNSLFDPLLGMLPDYAFQYTTMGYLSIVDSPVGFKWVQSGNEIATLTNGIFHANTTLSSPIVKVTGATASRVAVLDASKNVVSSSVSTTTLGYLDATSSVQTQLNSKVAKAGDTMTGDLTITGNNGVEFAGIKVNNTNLAGYCAINARADDGEVIQIAALNSGGAANAYGMWTANQFGLYSKRSLNIMTDTAGAEIKFATGTGGTQIAKFDSVGKFHCNGINLVSGTVENVPTPTAETHAANKAYADSVSIINALIFG